MTALSEPQQSPTARSEDPLRILVVDDDPILREFALVHLSADEAEVKVAGGGDEALALLADWAADVVLLDLETPRIDGLALLRALSQSQAHRHLPVIVVTAREDVAAIDRAYAAGAASFVSKPLNWRLLGRQIRFTHRACAAEQTAALKLADLARQTSRLLALAR
jgi:CheY-like chemotaxis protein